MRVCCNCPLRSTKWTEEFHMWILITKSTLLQGPVINFLVLKNVHTPPRFAIILNSTKSPTRLTRRKKAPQKELICPSTDQLRRAVEGKPARLALIGKSKGFDPRKPTCHSLLLWVAKVNILVTK